MCSPGGWGSVHGKRLLVLVALAVLKKVASDTAPPFEKQVEKNWPWKRAVVSVRVMSCLYLRPSKKNCWISKPEIWEHTFTMKFHDLQQRKALPLWHLGLVIRQWCGYISVFEFFFDFFGFTVPSHLRARLLFKFSVPGYGSYLRVALIQGRLSFFMGVPRILQLLLY